MPITYRFLKITYFATQESKNNMKIVVNTRFLLKDGLEGVGWVTYELLQRIVQNHPEDEFVFLFDRAYDPSFIFGPNVRPLVLFPQARHPFLWYWWFEFVVPKVLKKEKADVFFSLDGYTSLSTSFPTVMMIHDIAHQHFPEQVPLISKYYYHHFVPKFLNRVEQVLTVSNFTKQDIIRRYQIPENKIDVVYNGCRKIFRPISLEEQQATKLEYSEGAPYFFYVGAVHPRKNIHRLIQAFDRFKKETGLPHKLLIGGRFAWKTGVIKSTYEKATYREDIELLGYLKEEALYRLLAASACFVYLSVFEGFGLPVLEAFHAEVPVITANKSSLPEVAGDAALLVEPEDIDSIVAAMKKVIEEEGFGEDLVAKAKIQRRKFSWEESAKQVYKVLKEVAQKEGKV